MTDETRLAFAHPSERAKATAPEGPLDRISLSDHEREVEIGAFQAERGTTQRVRFNVVVEVRSEADPDADDVDRILSYDTIVEAIDIELAAERLNLLETLAARIAERILAHPLAARCFVRIEKLDRGPFALGVEIVRSAPEKPKLRLLTEEMPHPLIVFLSNTAISRADLAALLDRLESSGAPVIVCVGAADLPRPQAAHGMPQRRIELLAIEQNAWVLAARDDRCVVVDSRTELDWAMKQGQISVWAPSKLVLDAVEGPATHILDGESLALWLAESFEAERLVLLGGDMPEDAALPVQSWPAEALPEL
ncbi:dihydroneopterin aldolase [Fontisubflavum oceani]|uniref:dihydroneopterin aldolase n=1 Tax=Fontisubflavum oceani TaxID=2978973 RepID=UPI0025B4870F|nr:dihydroneopterin aldolase [Fontisubflavum oceani]WJY21440.1 dihydroneopterin aldolase [Fontisubflavum oceani]